MWLLNSVQGIDYSGAAINTKEKTTVESYRRKSYHVVKERKLNESLKRRSLKDVDFKSLSTRKNSLLKHRLVCRFHEGIFTNLMINMFLMNFFLSV